VLYIVNTELSLLSDTDPNNPMILEDNMAQDGAVIYAETNANVSTRRGNFVFRNNTVRTVVFLSCFSTCAPMTSNILIICFN
jgi:hypothetical protein